MLQLVDEEWKHLCVIFAEPWTVPWIVPPGDRDDYEIHLVEKGEGKFVIGEREFSVKPGDLVILHSIQGNAFKPYTDKFRLSFITFKFTTPAAGETLARFNELLVEEVMPYSTEGAQEISQLFYSIQKEVSLKGKGYMFRTKLLFGALIAKIMEYGSRSDNTDKWTYVGMGTRELIDRVILFLQKNYSRDIRLEELGRLVNLHPRYLCTLFRQITGSTVIEYVKDIRIEKAKRLLLYTALSITEIALDVGFGSSQYFSRVFSRSEGVDPRTYRKNGVYENSTRFL